MSDISGLTAALADRYAIERELGVGGMATVYLAKDLKHDRRVALKVLKPELAAVLGADRFVVEIKTTASLQHPHILPLFDSGTAGSFLFYVMPYVAGETIREKLNRETQFGVEDAVRIACEVADALDYAHRHGVIHRDIKPENILLHDGRAMVMDFGIALALSAAAGGRMTETGLSLGTPHYMSPEQATAEKELTPRSDVYSLASVLYEMLAGNPPHTGASAQQIIRKIVIEPVQGLTELRKTVPPNLAVAVTKALEKLPADRFESAKAFGDALANPAFTTASASGTGTGVYAGSGDQFKRLFIAALAVAIATTSGFAWALLRPHPVPDVPVVRMTYELPPGESVNESVSGPIAVSPQGDRLAYVTQGASGTHTVVRRTSELVGREIARTAFTNLTFSPDGRWLAYTELNSDDVRKVPVDGGQSVTLGSAANLVLRGLAWTAADTIVIGSSAGLWTVPAGGGPVRRLLGTDSANASVSNYPVALPDGKTVLYVVGPSRDALRLAVGSLTPGKTTVLDIPATSPLGMREGHLLYVTINGALMALPFDLKRRRATGYPIQIQDSVRVSAVGAEAIASLSASGTLAYVSGQSGSQLVLSVAGRGDAPLIAEPHIYNTPRFSPDGRKVAVTVAGTGSSDIWVYDLAAHTFTRLTTDGTNAVPEWFPDGKRILFRAGRQEKRTIWWQPADGSAKAEMLYQPDEPVNEAILSPDAKWLIYRTAPGARHHSDIFAVPLAGDRRTVLPLVTGPAVERMPRLSPDGRWLAYVSNESVRDEIYVRPFPGAGARVQVSNAGGIEPLWARSGRALYYRTPAGIVSVAVTTGATFSIGERRTVLTGEYLTDPSHQDYDVSPDGSQFLMLKQAGAEAKPIIVHNWGRELREKLAAGKK